MMATTTISFNFDTSVFDALWSAPREFAREMRIAATVQWYAQDGYASFSTKPTRGGYILTP